MPPVTKMYDVPPFLTMGLGWTMRDYEDRGVERRLLAPWANAEVSHAAADDQSADAAEVVGLIGFKLGV